MFVSSRKHLAACRKKLNLNTNYFSLSKYSLGFKNIERSIWMQNMFDIFCNQVHLGKM